MNTWFVSYYDYYYYHNDIVLAYFMEKDKIRLSILAASYWSGWKLETLGAKRKKFLYEASIHSKMTRRNGLRVKYEKRTI